jgi:hypothetical protein
MFELNPGAVIMELTFRVEYAATPGAPLLILDTVRVDKVNRLEVIVEPVRVDKDNDPVVMEAVVMEEPWIVLTVMAGARTFRRALKLASPDAISTMILFFGMLNNTK